jgi:sialate O-acetylesterase
MRHLTALLLIVLLFSIYTEAQVKLPQLISNGMVLQRDTDLKIWGWAAKDEKVALVFNGKSYSATTGSDGKWMVTLPKMKAGGPYSMDITASNQVHLTNILFGDVWLCSGQSNMVLNMERVKEKYPEEIARRIIPRSGTSSSLPLLMQRVCAKICHQVNGSKQIQPMY